jgi:hypothetical protein
MSFGGHVNDMVNRIKQNAALKNSRRRKFKGGNDYSKILKTKTEYDLPKLSKVELEKFKLKLQQEATQKKKKQLIYVMLFAVVSFFIFLIFNYY